MTVYFIGAGPGDPELITVKGQRLLRSCPVILYAGSLVPEAVLVDFDAGAEQERLRQFLHREPNGIGRALEAAIFDLARHLAIA